MPTEDPIDWKQSLPEEIRDNAAIKDFTDVGALAKSYMETKAMVGDSLRVPGVDAGEAAWNAFNTKLADKVPGVVKMPDEGDEEGLNTLWTKLGRPTTEDGYTAPEGLELPDGSKATAQKLGLTAKQFQAYIKHNAEAANETLTAAQAEQDATKNVVLGEWGAAKEQKLRQIRIMLESTDAPEAIKTMVGDLNVGGNFLKWAETIVTSLGGEGSTFGNDGASSQTGTDVTPAEAASQLGEIMNNPQHAYHNPNDPTNRAAVQRVLDLHDYKAGRTPQTKIG
jgi:hypothetical protein